MGVNRNRADWKKQKQLSPQWVELIGLAKSIVIFLAIAFTLRASVVEAFKIPSTSMLETLVVGDHILVNKLSYGMRVPFKKKSVWNFRGPKRGDVVVFTLPDDRLTPEIDETEINIIKRVIGLPGDKVEVRGMNVFINDELYEDRHAIWQSSGRKDFGPVIVPSDKVLLLGDNRDHSKDSRYWKDPFLSIPRIKGRAFLIYWNLADFGRMFHWIH